MRPPVVEDFWKRLASTTQARIALGRAGVSLPTQEVLNFSLAHARARDAVHTPLDHDKLAAEIADLGFATICVESEAPDRAAYLRRPDWGRTLSEKSRALLADRQNKTCDIAIVVADGLSATAVHSQVVPLLAAFKPYLIRAEWRVAPVVIASQARVALGDEIGALFNARVLVLLVGERPGLSSPDSLGIYLTYDPKPGRNDGERNCISNVRNEGLSHELAAFKLAWLVDEALKRKLTGVALKDESDLLLLADGRPAALP
ncbi:MAG: ethanolamine ammonia-lyase subunit EutC [Methylovirgula sp.]|uniref:ethanolamine ammonia-lyase subunit EutC n=1 Tax=Methylovirgula sp. TaxID=1978224 RepID=UPI0030765FB6